MVLIFQFHLRHSEHKIFYKFCKCCVQFLILEQLTHRTKQRSFFSDDSLKIPYETTNINKIPYENLSMHQLW